MPLDPAVDIAWPEVDGEPLLSERDRRSAVAGGRIGGRAAADVGGRQSVRRVASIVSCGRPPLANARTDY